MTAESPFCKFHQFGHCKFGQVCKKKHTQETCTTFHCKVEDCTSRHPKLCKFFAQRGWCKFGDECSFFHHSASEQINANKHEIENLKTDIEVLKCEIDTLKSRTLFLESILTKMDNIEDELKDIRSALDSEKSYIKQNNCIKCDFEPNNEAQVTHHVRLNHEDKQEEILMYKCDYWSTSRKGVNIHKGSKHKSEKVLETNQLSSSSTSQSVPSNDGLKTPKPCVRHDEGCLAILTDYFDMHSAICNDCTVYMETRQKSSPFPSNLCPCCHHLVDGEPFSLCSECLDYLSENGFSESDWGVWVLDRNRGKILCMQLDF